MATNEEQALFKGDANQQIDLTKEEQLKKWQLEQQTEVKIVEAQQASADVFAEQQTVQAVSAAPTPATQIIDEAKHEAEIGIVKKTLEKVEEAVKSQSPAVAKVELKFATELMADAKALLKEGEDVVKNVFSRMISKMGGGK